jgi:hypothetical protein
VLSNRCNSSLGTTAAIPDDNVSLRDGLLAVLGVSSIVALAFIHRRG